MNPEVSVVKRFEFPAGHRLLGYNGKCRNLHGHSFVAEVCVSAQHVDKMGFVVDFTSISHWLKDWIDTHWDHALIINRQDTKLLKFLKSIDKTKYYLLDANPTTENMAKHLYTQMHTLFIPSSPRIEISWVRIWESTTSYAEVNKAYMGCLWKNDPVAWTGCSK